LAVIRSAGSESTGLPYGSAGLAAGGFRVPAPPGEALPSGQWAGIVCCMSILKSAIRAGIALKVAQIAKRELSKPENQRKISEAVRKLQGTLRNPR
jgi:hypothetical protein